MDFSLEKIASILDIADENKYNIKNIILMEKERQGLSYTDLAMKLKKHNTDTSRQLGENILTISEKIKLALNDKMHLEGLFEDLCKVLEIEDSLPNRIKTYRYENQCGIDKRKAGRISKQEINKRAEIANKIRNDIDTIDYEEGEISIEEAILNGTSDVFYEGEWIDRVTYDELVEEKVIIEKILLIQKEYPDKLEEFLSQFNFTDDNT